MIKFFDGQSEALLEPTVDQRTRHPLVKSHLLEILSAVPGSGDEVLLNSFNGRGLVLNRVDSGLYLVRDQRIGDVGFLERLSPRVAVVYSVLQTQPLDAWVRRVVYSSPDLDHVWLSGLTFGVLWGLVTKLSKSDRFTRLVFTHDSIFEVDRWESESELDEEENGTTDENHSGDQMAEEKEGIEEHRVTSFRLVDRLGIIQSRLQRMQDVYSPLYAISQLRFPSPVGPGGHDFYDNGKVTNRSPSFRDHRAHLLFVVRIYEKLLQSTEQSAWYSIKESIEVPGKFGKIVGSPVTIRFQEPGLDPDVFKGWITKTFSRKRNRFRLWGNPIWLGPTKVHVYGVDRHLWQPLWLELTESGCTAIIPNGTCGNTVHRLVTNIQRFLDPGASVQIGSKPYSEFVQESAMGVPYDVKSE